MMSRGGVEGGGKFGNCSACRVKLQTWERVLRGGTGNYVGAGVGGNYVFPFKFCEILKQRSDPIFQRSDPILCSKIAHPSNSCAQFLSRLIILSSLTRQVSLPYSMILRTEVEYKSTFDS